MLTEFMSDWRAEEGRWSDHVVKTVAAESDANKRSSREWASHWIDRAIEAAKPLVRARCWATTASAADTAGEAAMARARSLGLSI